ncbi:hypothetical protein [Streptomyces sp. NPDC004324]
MGFAVCMTLPGLVAVPALAAFAGQAPPRAGRAGLLPWPDGTRTTVDPYGGTAVVRPGRRS